jgi:hypothetical protein
MANKYSPQTFTDNNTQVLAEAERIRNPKMRLSESKAKGASLAAGIYCDANRSIAKKYVLAQVAVLACDLLSTFNVNNEHRGDAMMAALGSVGFTLAAIGLTIPVIHRLGKIEGPDSKVTYMNAQKRVDAVLLGIYRPR